MVSRVLIICAAALAAASFIAPSRAEVSIDRLIDEGMTIDSEDFRNYAMMKDFDFSQ